MRWEKVRTAWIVDSEGAISSFKFLLILGVVAFDLAPPTPGESNHEYDPTYFLTEPVIYDFIERSSGEHEESLTLTISHLFGRAVRIEGESLGQGRFKVHPGWINTDEHMEQIFEEVNRRILTK